MTLSELYLSFSGRISRKTYWLKGVVPYIIIIGILQMMMFATFSDRGPNGLIVGLISIVSILLIWPALAVSFKRWHDRGKSGWWILIGLVPLIGGLWVLIECGFLAGTPGPNKYGPAPDTMPTAAEVATQA
ncbi:MAG: DUF805 domain-containing protein [Anaerolineae bacterium]